MSASHKRLFRALAREGILVSHENAVYTIRAGGSPDAPAADILLPDSLPLEGKAVAQLLSLATASHPGGGQVCRVCATPDFHPGDSGIAIGSVVETDGLLIPQAIGTDINCGMRLHTTGINLDTFLSRKAEFVSRMKGDYLLGTRDVVMSAAAMRAMFQHGVPAWALEFKENPMGRIAQADFEQIWSEQDRILGDGSFEGDVSWAPNGLAPMEGVVRDEGLATVGRGNHFVEVQVVEDILDRQAAYANGLRVGEVVFMVHSGSRSVGLAIGGRWLTKVREAWPIGVKYPTSGVFPLSWDATPDLCMEYLRAERTASNYGFVNRLLLAELLRLRLREVFGPSVEAGLVADIPHNYTSTDLNGLRYITRKGACPAYAGMPVIIPGSMGTSSFFCMGLGNDRWLSSASHGAGRAERRGSMGRSVKDAAHERALGLEGVECITLREERRVEEAPAAYKAIQPIIDAQVQAGTIHTVARMKPILTFKA